MQNAQESDVAPLTSVGIQNPWCMQGCISLTLFLIPTSATPSVALRFKEYQEVIAIPYNSSEDYRQLSVAVWVFCENDSSCSDPCYLLAKKGSFALGLRSDEIAMAFHNKVLPLFCSLCYLAKKRHHS